MENVNNGLITVAARGMKVTLNVTVTTLVSDMTITTQDGSGKMLSFDISVKPS